MKLFRNDNIEGYTQDELDRLNAEWEVRVNSMSLDEFTEDYDFQAKVFCDEVAGR